MRTRTWFGLSAMLMANSATAATTLVNPGFEANGTGVASPAGWISAGSTQADFTEAGGYSGSFRLSHWSNVDYAVDTRQNLRGLSSGFYTLRARVKRSPGQNDSFIALECDGSRQRAYQVSISSSSSSEPELKLPSWMQGLGASA